MKTIGPHLKSRSIDRAKFSLVTRPTKVRLIRESIIILKNWLKILLRLIRKGDLNSNIYGSSVLKYSYLITIMMVVFMILKIYSYLPLIPKQKSVVYPGVLSI